MQSRPRVFGLRMRGRGRVPLVATYRFITCRPTEQSHGVCMYYNLNAVNESAMASAEYVAGDQQASDSESHWPPALQSAVCRRANLVLTNLLPAAAPHWRASTEREVLMATRIRRGKARVRREQVVADGVAVWVARRGLGHNEHAVDIQVPSVIKRVFLTIPCCRPSQIDNQVCLNHVA